MANFGQPVRQRLMVPFGMGRRRGGMAPAAFVAFLATEVGEFTL
jgi:hypothetical protein